MELILTPELRELVRKLEHPDKLLEQVSMSLAEESIDLVKQGFRDQSDPYGTPWPPKKVPDQRAILTGRTGRMRNSFHRRELSADGFAIESGVVYSRYHQDARPPRTRRMMVPDPTLGLPATWDTTLREAADEMLSLLLGKAVP
jgi:hypothetical protein